jgi:NAD(P)-dependent dehydrogenase (short-subunit alcohol dehydrogenase family)
MSTLDGKVILLTGATDGMGRALAADLGREARRQLRTLSDQLTAR